jgi:hypothetical protein
MLIQLQRVAIVSRWLRQRRGFNYNFRCARSETLQPLLRFDRIGGSEGVGGLLGHIGEFEAFDAVENVAHLIAESGRVVTSVAFVDGWGARDGAKAGQEVVEAVGLENGVKFVVVAMAENFNRQVKLVESEY